jgi:hypothetical protein
MLEVYRVIVFAADKHLAAPVKVVHHIFQRWLERVSVDGVEVDHLVRSNLDAVVLM